MFAKNDEEKRNRLWKTAISVSTLVIILIAVFFVIKLFTSNPLEGTWVREDSDLMLTISGEDQAVVQWPEEFESADVRVSVECSVDTDMKVITLHTDAAELQKAAEESGVDTAKLDTALQKLDGTYEYNLEQKELTLTEREYGSQMTFKKNFSSAVNLTLFLGEQEEKMEMLRNRTKEIRIGNVWIGGSHPVAIQSMTNTKTEDVAATVEQILALEAAGCEIIRCAVPTMEAALALKEIKKQIHIPLVADIHFDYRLAIAAIENGADKIRINPGNIGSKERVQAVVEKAKEYNVPIRVGVNSGSLEKNLLEKYGGVTAEGIVESALDKVRMIEEMGYDNLVVSIKSSDVLMCVRAHELIAEKCQYPLHVGITESGTVYSGNIKSSVGLGIILHEGIGNTIRVSLTGDPTEEIRTAKLILKTLGMRKGGIEVVSCPTCGRTRIDLIALANQVEKMVQDIDLDIKVAVMGCVVNGPGEAKEADIGIAGGIGEGLLIKKGEIVRKVKEEELLETLRQELLNWNR